MLDHPVYTPWNSHRCGQPPLCLNANCLNTKEVVNFTSMTIPGSRHETVYIMLVFSPI